MVLVLFPLNKIVGRLNGFVGRLGIVVQNHVVKISPNQLVNEDIRPILGLFQQRPNADCTEAQMNPEPGSCVPVRSIATVFVPLKNFQGNRLRRPLQKGRNESHGFQGRDGSTRLGHIPGVAGLCATNRQFWIGGKGGLPFFAVGRKDRVIRAVVLGYLVSIKNDLVFDT